MKPWFRELCHENGVDFAHLLRYTELRLLSNGICLKRVSELFNTIVEFFEEHDFDLSGKLKAIHHDNFFMTNTVGPIIILSFVLVNP